MVATESSRHRLFKKLEEVLGMEEAGTLFELVPPVGWGDVATKRDLEEFRLLTKRDLEGLRRDLHELRVHTKKDLDLVESRLNNRLTEELTTRLRGLFFAIAALFIGVISLLLAVPHLI